MRAAEERQAARDLELAQSTRAFADQSEQVDALLKRISELEAQAKALSQQAAAAKRDLERLKAASVPAVTVESLKPGGSLSEDALHFTNLDSVSLWHLFTSMKLDSNFQRAMQSGAGSRTMPWDQRVLFVMMTLRRGADTRHTLHLMGLPKDLRWTMQRCLTHCVVVVCDWIQRSSGRAWTKGMLETARASIYRGRFGDVELVADASNTPVPRHPNHFVQSLLFSQYYHMSCGQSCLHGSCTLAPTNAVDLVLTFGTVPGTPGKWVIGLGVQGLLSWVSKFAVGGSSDYKICVAS